MRNLIVPTALIAGLMLTSTAFAAPRSMTYDCAKPGNANKTACKSTAVAPPPAKAAAMTSAPVRSALVRATAPVSGGRIVTATTKTGKTVHYNCGKAGNVSKTACK